MIFWKCKTQENFSKNTSAFDDKYEIDAKATELFDKLIETEIFIKPTNE